MTRPTLSLVPKIVPDVIETPRLLLRAPRLEDVPELCAAVLESLPELSAWMTWATPDYSLATCETNTRRAIAEFTARESLHYRLFDRATGACVGYSSFHHPDWSVPKLELGYWLRSSATGQGLMREGVAALCELAEREWGAARLEIRCDTRNRKSAHVAEACGFRLEGTLRREARDPQGQLRDTYLYARTK